MFPINKDCAAPCRTTPGVYANRSDTAADPEAYSQPGRNEPPHPGGDYGCWTTNLTSGVLVWNEALCALAGRSAARGAFSVDESLRYFAVHSQTCLIQALQGAWRDGTGFALEAEMVSEGGRHFRVEIVCGGRLGSGPDVLLSGTVQDISARKAVAAAHERYRVGLEELAAASAVKLQAATTAGEAAHRAVSRLLSSMSHEFRTPLNAIVGSAYRMQALSADPRSDGWLVKIIESAEHVLEMIDDVLDFARLEAELLPLETTDFVLDSVLDATCRPLVGRAAAKALEIVLDVDPALTGTLIGDPLRLGQVLRKLMETAVKFTSCGAVLLSASKVSESESDISVRFEVRDTGVGVPEDKQPDVFGPFEQASDPSTRGCGSMGMGLAISRELASLMGGELRVEGGAGGGSAFGFTAPFRKGSGGQFIARRTVSELAGRRVLLADDQPWLRQAMAKLLREFGVRVDAAESGAEILTKIRHADGERDPFELVLIDSDLLNADDRHGLFRTVASLMHGSSPSLWILMVFGRVMSLADARDAGFHSILHKPVTLARLDRCLSECLEGGFPPGGGATAAKRR